MGFDYLSQHAFLQIAKIASPDFWQWQNDHSYTAPMANVCSRSYDMQAMIIQDMRSAANLELCKKES